MSEREWKPGDVALVSFPDTYRVAMRQDGGWLTANGSFSDAVSYEPRPVVVIDPDDREQVKRLARAMDDQFSTRGWASQGDPDPDVLDAIQAAVRVLSEGVTR